MDGPAQHTLDAVARNLADIGAVSLEQFLADAPAPPPPPLPLPPADVSPVTQLHQACQRTLRSTDALAFDFVDHATTRQCILTITKPDGSRRSYATQPIFTRKNDAKSEAAKLAIQMGALDFLASTEAPTADSLLPSDTSATAHDSFIDDIERCCREWRAGHVIPHWVPFSDSKSGHKHGCALRIQLSPHVVRVFVADPTFESHSLAKAACAQAAVCEGALDFIKHGNGQIHPSSPLPASSTNSPPLAISTPWTLQSFYDSLPRPFPESFDTNDASEINAPAWLNTIVQNARGGKLILSFFFTSDGPPGLHGCLLKLDRPGEYKASLVDPRFPKRSDAKAAVSFQAMSQGIGDYIRSITSAINAKVTHTMRSFSSSLVYPALVAELGKIGSGLLPHFEYNKERDAFSATLIVKLSTSPTSEQVRRYTVSTDYRNKADAKVGVICHAAQHGVVEFVCFRGADPPDGYLSPYTLDSYDPNVSRKRKQPAPAEDAEQGLPAKKKRKQGRRRSEVPSPSEGSHLTPVVPYPSIHLCNDQTPGISGPGNMGLSQTLPSNDLSDPPQLGFRSDAARPAVYGHGVSYNARMYPAVLDPRFAGNGGLDGRAYSVYPMHDAYRASHRVSAIGDPSSEAGPSRVRSPLRDQPRSLRSPAEELEPGEVLSSAESEFSESSSRNDDGAVVANERDACANGNDEPGRTTADMEDATQGSRDKGKGKDEEASPSITSTAISRGDPFAATNGTDKSHVKELIDYCARHRRGTPSFHETPHFGRFLVWIVIGKERFDLPKTYASVEEGRQRVAKQVLARLSKG